ncbi:MAG: small multi-drug export protein [Candidatus Thermoplasmatota archaeon]|nr:small multi-drug export protein [Candidatus Thermoplasmatota archaeon]MBS3801867.1 small multi-drug export protein [Candidatus Thermoplasmatota archaeon]
MKRRTVEMGLLKFIVPFIIGLATVYTVGMLLPANSTYKYWALIAAYFFPPFGKETIIPIGVYGGEITVPFSSQIAVINPINPLIMALSIAFVDIIVALFLMWNYDFAKQVPFVGRFMKKVESIGQKSSSKYAWITPLRFIGIVLFVMVPFQGSGGLVGSIVGRLIGMKPMNTFLAITVGAIVGCSFIAFFSDIVFSVFFQNFLLGLMILIILIVIGIMIAMYKRNKDNKEKNKKTND